MDLQFVMLQLVMSSHQMFQLVLLVITVESAYLLHTLKMPKLMVQPLLLIKTNAGSLMSLIPLKLLTQILLLFLLLKLGLTAK